MTNARRKMQTQEMCGAVAIATMSRYLARSTSRGIGHRHKCTHVHGRVTLLTCTCPCPCTWTCVCETTAAQCPMCDDRSIRIVTDPMTGGRRDSENMQALAREGSLVCWLCLQFLLCRPGSRNKRRDATMDHSLGRRRASAEATMISASYNGVIQRGLGPADPAPAPAQYCDGQNEISCTRYQGGSTVCALPEAPLM